MRLGELHFPQEGPKISLKKEISQHMAAHAETAEQQLLRKTEVLLIILTSIVSEMTFSFNLVYLAS